jgi:hypothetical protein
MMRGHRTRHYAFEGNAGDRVRLALATPAETAALHLGRGPEETIASAGAGDGAPATLIAILPETRRYQVQVHLPVAAEGAAAAVPFTLDFERRAAGPPREPRAIRTGETAAGELGLGSNDAAEPYSEGTRILVETYRLAVEAGRPVTVTLESSAFDPFLEAGDMTAIGFASALGNDDYGDGLNSRLVLTPERSGSVVLRVRALGTGTGPFRLTVAPGAAAPVEGAQPDDHDHH